MKAHHLIALTALLATAALAQPTIFWASDPVLPDDTVLVCGDGFGDGPKVQLYALPDVDPAAPGAAVALSGEARACEALQPTDQSVKFLLPDNWQPGAYAFRVVGPEGASEPTRLNCPTPYWCQGDLGTKASPGGWLRVFGRCLLGESQQATVLLRPEGRDDIRLTPEEATPWSLSVRFPDNLAAGPYRVFVHNGHGGPQGWSEAPPLTVAASEPWPQDIFNVKDLGASGAGRPHDGTAIRMALKRAEANGGGVVYFPRGRYYVAGTLEVPEHTVLRGESAELVCLFWPDTDEPYTLVQGSHHFGLEDLTLYCSNYEHCVAAELGQPQSGHTFLRRVRVRADMYRGHLKPEQVDERFRASLRKSTGGGDIVRFGGENIEILDCDLYGSGRSLYLLRVRGGRITRNTLHNGRWGWYCLDGSDGLILENNQIIGADLMSTGGSLNCYSSAYSQNVYYARNKLSKMHGWDREAMTSDAGYGAYFGGVAEAGPDRLVLADDPTWNRKADWTGGGVFILGGTGLGQYRQIASYDGRTVTLDRPWAVVPDESSSLSITMLQRQYLFIGNEFEDVGIGLQYYGTSIDHVAAGNKCARGGGFYASGRWYRHFQPSWFCQFFDNEILEGNCYRFGPNNATNAGSSFLGTFGLQSQGGTAPLALCGVHRRNHLHSNAELRFIGVSAEHPGLRDVVAEHNVIENSPRGIYVDNGCVGVLLRENQFNDVEWEQVTERDLKEQLLQRRAALLDQADPVAHYTFDQPAELTVPDDSGHDFWATATGPIESEQSLSGTAPRFDGSAYFVISDDRMLQFPRLTVSAWVLPDTVEGRWGVVAKRSRGGRAPYVLAIREGGITFEATDASGDWSYNMTGKRVVEPHVWSHVVAVCEEGVGVKVYCNGELVGEKAATQPLAETDDVLTIGYENWGGQPAQAGQSGNFHGVIDEVKIWSRPLSPDEISEEYERLREQAEADAQRRADEAEAAAERAARFAAEVVAPEGLDWQLVKADDFERETLGPEWKTLRGKWSLQEGRLRCTDISFLGYTKPVPSPVRIEFDAMSPHPGDLTAFYGTEKAAYLGGYFIGFASNGNTANKILRLGEQVATSDKPLAKPGQWHHVIAHVIGGKVQLIVDGEPALEYADPTPVAAANMPGLIAWSEGQFDNVRIYTGP